MFSRFLNRFWLLCLGTLVPVMAFSGTITWNTFGTPLVAIAQQDVAADAAAEVDAVDEADDAEAGDSSTSPPIDEQSLLEMFFSSLGWLFFPVFLALSFTLVALLIMNILTARRDNVVPLQLVEGFENHLNEKQYQDAFDLAKSDESFLGQVLAAGLAKVSVGYQQAIEAMQEVGEEESMKLEHRLSYIALIGTISPMVGLFGTVWGMIVSFKVIADHPDVTPKPYELADGISTALVTTLVGLAIAIPAIAAYNILRNRVSRLVLEVGIVSEGLMSRFEISDETKG